jgi:hypothetical protein
MSYDADGAIQTLQDGLNLEKKNRFNQADSLVIFLQSNFVSKPRFIVFDSWYSNWHGRY